MKLKTRHTTMCKVFTALLVTLLAVVVPAGSHVLAEDVVLQHANGSFEVTGKLVNFDGQSFIVQSSQFGRMTVSSKNFRCAKGPCPKSYALLTKPKHPASKTLRFVGSDAIGAHLLPQLLEAYAEQSGHQSKRVYSSRLHNLRMEIVQKSGIQLESLEINTEGSATSFPALSLGDAQIGMSSRPILDHEITNMAKKGISGMSSLRREHILALDGILIVLAPSNPVNALSLKQVAAIFSGQVTNWAQVGGAPGKINLHIRNEKSGALAVFNRLVLFPHRKKMSPKHSKYSSYVDLSDAVARDPNGIGFTGMAFRRNTKVVALSTACSGAKHPTIFDIKTEEYPLSFRHYLYTTGKLKSSYGKKFLRYALSTKAERLIVEQGFVGLSPETRHFNKQSDRIIRGLSVAQKDLDAALINQFNNEFKNAERLSSTFRFRPATVDLDNRSLKDVIKLARLFRSRRYRNKEIFLIGFTDASGDTDRNIELALSRAGQVKKAIIKASRGKITPNRLHVRGYGELLPVSCNNTNIGREKNRRVEVWLR